MVTYSDNILPRCKGIAKAATEQNQTFTKDFLNTEVKYYDKMDEPKKVTHPQRLDDLYGTLFSSFTSPLPAGTPDKEKKKMVQTVLDQYHAKQASARAYLVLASQNGGMQKPYDKSAVGWFDRTQKTLEDLILGLQKTLNEWKV
ncbi:hypothetical protein A1O7_08834 [Cladophialophora yegresii CBS 114405]|uniref:Uncharacterized protein n=1 Tax=Cladophialophora yegresii CBS 114405 TaxID=1182544 RepID=W9VK85_9EURO|nr:uncharacterized protein A1O7_08834 [Cladophialophora yegresii CBS 114405]EXJ55903.1 hypothetical protein A1O7_08834 [Cladophialophora yegresii CBS 114405]